MPFCPNCGSENREGVKFCWSCGHRFEITPVEETPAEPVVEEPIQPVEPLEKPSEPETESEPEHESEIPEESDAPVDEIEEEPVVEDTVSIRDAEPESEPETPTEEAHTSAVVITPDPIPKATVISTPSKKKNTAAYVAVALVVILLIAAAAFMLMPAKYDVSVDVRGSGYVIGEGTYEEGSTITLEAVGTNGQEFYEWSDGVTDAKRQITVDSDIHLTAYFGTFFDITLASSEGGDATISDRHVLKGESVTLKATPDIGRQFSHWEVNGRNVSTSATYTFTPTSDLKIEAVFEWITFEVEYGISGYGNTTTVTGAGTYEYGHVATLRASVAEGYEIVGWFVNGKSVSKLSYYAFQVFEDTFVVLEIGIIHDATFSVTTADPYVNSEVRFESKYKVEIVQSVWTFTEQGTGAEPSWTNKGSGKTSAYIVLDEPTTLHVSRTVTYLDGKSATWSMNVVVDGIEQRTLAWKYQEDTWYSGLTDWWLNNRDGNIKLDLSYEWFYDYRSDDVPRGYGPAHDSIDEYVTEDDPVIQLIADRIESMTGGMSQLDRLNCVLKLVQSIDYQYDIDGMGVSEWYKYPAETLWDMKGDCEDHAILFAAIAQAMGYDVIIHRVQCVNVLTGETDGYHIAPAVAVSGASGSYYTLNGVKYYYCEATSIVGTSVMNNANVGYKPSGYNIIDTYVI